MLHSVPRELKRNTGSWCSRLSNVSTVTHRANTNHESVGLFAGRICSTLKFLTNLTHNHIKHTREWAKLVCGDGKLVSCLYSVLDCKLGHAIMRSIIMKSLTRKHKPRPLYEALLMMVKLKELHVCVSFIVVFRMVRKWLWLSSITKSGMRAENSRWVDLYFSWTRTSSGLKYQRETSLYWSPASRSKHIHVVWG